MLDLFSGIGGFSLAADWLGGFETVQFVEKEPFCQRILSKHWPSVPIHDDICTFNPEPGSADVVVGGFPCQDISTAGKQAGIKEGTRSGLFYELMRVVRLVGPRYVVLENVSNILSGSTKHTNPRGRCVCGWDFGWGGLYRDPSSDQERIGSLLSAHRCGDDGQGIESVVLASHPLRRIHQSAQKSDRQMGGGITLGANRSSGGRVPRADGPTPTHQAGASTDRDCTGAHDHRKRQEVDCCNEGRSEGVLGEDQGTKQERTIRLRPSAVVCPNCGRSMDEQPIFSIDSPWHGTLLGTLAEAGFDAEWACIPASDVGACHRRDRWWCVAHAYRDGIQRGDTAEVSWKPALQRDSNERSIKNLCRRPDSSSPRLCRSAYGIPAGVDRLKALGNAVVPQVAMVPLGRVLELAQVQFTGDTFHA